VGAAVLLVHVGLSSDVGEQVQRPADGEHGDYLKGYAYWIVEKVSAMAAKQIITTRRRTMKGVSEPAGRFLVGDKHFISLHVARVLVMLRATVSGVHRSIRNKRTLACENFQDQ
jgi:hypothetical protein